ncbi:CoA transferase [Pseudooceanicola sp. LIPI14-2-Ac024]|uniref:CaiB/BaiF CoA-transferase family protein n=1 Tax=Pseudooceanicola sp. LIPI14-2-Ac024 TaxID=3344875 RepID=UPI0035CEC303
MTDTGALAGLRVLDLTDHRGVLAGRMLAMLGADVLQVEPVDGSSARRQGPFDADGRSLYWAAYGTGRTSLVLDREADAERLMALAAQADVVLESGNPGRDGFLDTAALLGRNPGAVHVIVTPFGLDGPKAGYADSDLTAWASGGPLKPTESQTKIPTRVSVPQAYHHAAADALCGAMLALEARRKSGRGQRVVSSAQASASQCTLSLSLATVIGHPDYVFRAEIKSKKKRELDLSGSGSRTQRSKWPVKDGLVEMHLALGPAAGRFTNNLFALMKARGACSDEFASWDWVTLPPLIENDVISEEQMEKARDEVAAFLAPMTKRETVEMALEHRLMLAPIMDASDLADSPHAAARGFMQQVGDLRLPGVPALGFDEGFVAITPAPDVGAGGAETEARWLTGRDTLPYMPEGAPVAVAKPLEHLTVLDLSWVVAGPMIGRCMADFGARVIRVESSKRPEVARLTGPFPGGERNLNKSGLYENCNAGKLGVTLDLSTEEGRAVVRDLAKQADVLVESFAPGQMDRWGLGYDVLGADNPGLVMLSTSLMGQAGPWKALAGFGNIGAAMSGLQVLAGREGQPPTGPYGPYTDYCAPRLALPVLLAALDMRRKTGKGRWLDISQAEAGMQFIAETFADYSANGHVTVAQGNRDPQIVPNNVYPCLAPEGETAWVAVSVTDEAVWKALAGATSIAGLGDLALATLEDRKAREAEIDAALADWTATREAGEVEALLQAAGVPAYVVASNADMAADPQLAAWGHFLNLPREDGTSSWIEACRFKLSDTPGVPRVVAPHYGRDGTQVLHEMLGMEDSTIAALAEQGVLS